MDRRKQTTAKKKTELEPTAITAIVVKKVKKQLHEFVSPEHTANANDANRQHKHKHDWKREESLV